MGSAWSCFLSSTTIGAEQAEEALRMLLAEPPPKEADAEGAQEPNSERMRFRGRTFKAAAAAAPSDEAE
eukprot:812925-Prymnesium_polylepis.2